MKRKVILSFFFSFSFLFLWSQSDTASIISSYAKTTSPDSTIVHPRNRKHINVEPVLVVDTVNNNRTSENITDSALRKKHNPKIAAALSIIPGAGQIYNKKAWKIPIFYAGLGATGVCAVHFAKQSNALKMEYIYRKNGNTEKLNPSYNIYTNANLLAIRDDYRRYMEISIAAFAIVYVLNIIDATVDAHLFFFDISDELSLSIQPHIYNNYAFPSLSYGIGLKFNF